MGDVVDGQNQLTSGEIYIINVVRALSSISEQCENTHQSYGRRFPAPNLFTRIKVSMFAIETVVQICHLLWLATGLAVAMNADMAVRAKRRFLNCIVNGE